MENKNPAPSSQSRRNNEAMTSRTQSATYVSNSENPYMLSPPPEEVLESARRASKLLGSAPRPLASSLVTNGVQSDLQASKRKRVVVRSVKDTPPRPSAAQTATTTPNPRLKKQIRYGSQSPTSSAFPDASPPAMLTNSTSESLAMNVEIRSVDFADPTRPMKQSPKATTITRARKTSPIDLTSGRVTTSPSSRASTKAGNGKRAATTTRKKTRAANKSASTKPAQVQHLRIKTEPPEVDLSLIPPPPSPTDDPILLVGSPVRKRSSASPRKATTGSRATRPVNLVDFEIDLELENDGREAGPSTNSKLQPPGNAQEEPMELGIESVMPGERKREHSSSSWGSPSAAFDFGGPQDSFDDSSSDWQSPSDNANSVFSHFTHLQDNNTAPDNSDGWSDSEDDDTMPVSEGEGDFTGRFYVYKVKTKMDPPSSVTAMRMQEWGRPISPHPKRLFDGDSMTIEDEEEDTDKAVDPVGEDKVMEGEVSHPTRRKGLRLSELEELKFGQRAVHSTDLGRETEAPEPQLDVSHISPSPEKDLGNKDTGYHEQIDQEVSFKAAEPEIGNESYNDLYEAEVETPEISMRDAELSTNAGPSTSAAPLSQALDEKNKPVEEADEQDESVSNSHSELGGIGSQDTLVRVEEDGEDDSSESEESYDLSVVKIVSSDPAAAARAAAILKMHDYDMIERAKKQKRDHSLTQEAQFRKMRRKSASEAGIRKTSPYKRRKTIGSFSTSDFAAEHIPLTELLEQAEQSLRKSTPVKQAANASMEDFFDPCSHHRMSSVMMDDEPPLIQPGPREWTKGDWKLLDSCFTDERRLLAERKGLDEGFLVNADDVDLENVVERFVSLIGSETLLSTFGREWELDRILKRAQALRKRQRSGRGAPPTPSMMGRTSRASSAFYSPSSSNASMIVPDFTPTPIERLRQLPRLPNGPLFPSLMQTPQRPSQLSESSLPRTPVCETSKSREESPIDPDRELMPPPPLPAKVLEPPPSAVRRSINYLTSWLRPTPSKPLPPTSRIPVGPVLPLPPQEILERHRGPVSTPKKKPAEKIVHPKETVELQPAPQPPSRIPKLLSKVKPQRLVDLKHITPPQEEKIERRVISRKSSTSSVKDLIQNFEKLDEEQRRHTIGSDLRRVQSFDGMRSKSIGTKPIWRP